MKTSTFLNHLRMRFVDSAFLLIQHNTVVLPLYSHCINVHYMRHQKNMILQGHSCYNLVYFRCSLATLGNKTATLSVVGKHCV